MSIGVPRVLGGLAVFVAATALVQGYPSVYPTGTTIYEPDKTWSGYTFFGTPDQQGAVVIDMNGRLVKRWPQVAAVPAPMRLLPGGFMMGGDRRRRPHQEARRLVQVDWDGNVVWAFDQGDRITDDKGVETWIARQHHDWQREGSPVGYFAPGALPLVDRGRTLVLAHKNVTVPAITDKQLEDDRLVEVSWDGRVVWDWLASDHVDELGFSAEARAALRADPNWNEERKSADWLHINAASYLGPNQWHDAGDGRFHPDNIMISSREANIIAIVERATGRIAWRMGPDYRDTPALATLGQIVGQHHPHIIPKGLPGAGNLLVFDNGGVAGYGAPNPTAPTGRGSVRRIQSRVLEVNPVTFEKVWDYSDRRSGERVVLQPLREQRAAAAERQHLDHRGLGRAGLRADARQGNRLGVRQPVLRQGPDDDQPHLPRASGAVRLGAAAAAPGRDARPAPRQHDVSSARLGGTLTAEVERYRPPRWGATQRPPQCGRASARLRC